MREALRGALLSVLFFGLMIGGSPVMVAASSPTSVVSAHMSPEACNANGGVWAYPTRGNPNGWCSFDGNDWDIDTWCDDMLKLATGMGFDAGLFGGAGWLMGNPFLTAIGIGLGAEAFGIGLVQFWECSLGG
jgi:hypothetical protein